MSLLLSDIKMPLEADFSALPQLVAAQFSLPPASVRAVRILRQSLDARKKSDIHFRLSVVAQLEAACQVRLLKAGDARVSAYTPPEKYALLHGAGKQHGRIAIIGFGPAGLFAAYFLAKEGYKPLVIERGGDMDTRRAAVENFWNTGALDVNANVAFGEGGAGTFSDGKLTSRSKDPRAETVLETFIEHGADDEIRYKAKPHIGTDRLQGIIKEMRASVIRMGGEVRFHATLEDITLQNGELTHILVAHERNKERIAVSACILSIGQAARDTYRMLLKRGLQLQPKPFAVGVRIEHPQGLIDRAQFGELAGHPRLGAAEYALRAKSGGRGVYTFCMCPGGHAVAAASDMGQVVVNGMSNHARDGENGNAAIVVQVGPQDFGTQPLDGVKFQQELEAAAFRLGGGGFIAPAQRLSDFMQRKKSKGDFGIKPTYRPGVSMQSLDECLPAYVADGIREAIPVFARQLKGFDYPDAVLTAVESRTSAPVRILRAETGEAVNAKMLYPVGEGAGYAGGIVSAAIDGMIAAERIAARFAP